MFADAHRASTCHFASRRKSPGCLCSVRAGAPSAASKRMNYVTVVDALFLRCVIGLAVTIISAEI